MSTCSREHRGGAIWYPFSSSGLGANETSRRAHLLTKSTPHAAPPSHSRRQASRRPSPPRAPLPRRRVRRGCAANRPRPRVRAVRPARGNPWGRSGRLHAPEAARTGPVNALRRCSSWSPPGRWLNGHNGHFSCQPGRDHLGTSPGGYGSGFNGPRAVLKSDLRGLNPLEPNRQTESRPVYILPPTGTNDSTLNRQGSGDPGPFRGRRCAEMCY